MSSNPPSSSHSSPHKSIRLALTSVCFIAFVAGSLLQGCVSSQSRSRKAEIAKQTRDHSSGSSSTDSTGTDPQHDTPEASNHHAAARRHEVKTDAARTAAVERREGEGTPVTGSPLNDAKSVGKSTAIRETEEATRAASEEKSGSEELQLAKRSAASSSLVDSERVRDRELNGSGGRRMRLPSGARNTNQSTSQVGQTSGEVATTSGPDVVQIIGPASQDEDLRKLPFIPPTPEEEEEPLRRHPETFGHGVADPQLPYKPPSSPASMPSPIRNFDGVSFATAGSGLIPPDTDGDVGPNHYIQSVNSAIQVFSKTGTTLSGPTTFNSFFSALGGSTPCGSSQNRGDGVVFYDHMANRWVVSDFAFQSFPGTSFYECIGVSKTSDPVAGGWWLYALQIDSANPSFLGDYPKFGLWPDAYYFSVNLFSDNSTFNGVRVYALNRSAMINGTGAPNPGAVAFTVSPATLGDAYTLLPATFRTGSSPPGGTPEYFLAINSSLNAGTVENQVFAWRFHVDFNTPANSTFGLGATHTPNGAITVNGFVDAFTSGSFTNIIPQAPGAPLLDSLGDRLMTPVVYQNLSGESLWASHTVNNDQNGTGPCAIRWYKFNVTGSTIPGTPSQQQTFDNGADGLYRWMPSIAVDSQGDMSIGYSVSSFSLNPAIRYAGRLASDPPNLLSQGEAELIAGGGYQQNGRWGDYSALSIDPSDNCTFWHTNEYYSATSSANWNTRIGSFKFPSCGQSCPTVTGAVSGGGTICPGSSTTVTVNVSGGALPYTVKLTNNAETQSGTASQTQFIFTVSPAANTTYQVDIALSHDANNCPLANSGSATVNLNAGPATPSITTSSAVCAGSTGNQASGPAGATTYAWIITNGAFTSAVNIRNVTYTAGASGNVTLGLTVTNAVGCAASNSVNVPINAVPANADIAINGPQAVTVSGSSGTFTLTFKGQTTIGMPFDSSATFVQGKLYQLSTIGVGGVSVTKNGNVYTVTFTGFLTGPQPLMTGAGSGGASVTVVFAICAGAAGNQATGPASPQYLWSISNGTITSANNIQTITYTAGGAGAVTLNLTVTNSGACSASSSAMITIKPIALDLNHQSFAGNGGTGTVNVTPSDPSCAWTASTPAAFIHITSGGSGSGNGSVQYSVDANPGPSIRNGVITIGGQAFTVYQGINFLDVPSNDPFYLDIGKLSARGVTLGCGGGNYCKNDPVTRDQMAAFILRAKGEFNPPTPPTQRYNDVPASNPFYNFVDRLAVLQITLGCSGAPPLYCPGDPVLREQMAAFIMRGLGEFNPPTPPMQRFDDVPPSNPFYKFIDRLAVLQITLGCSDIPPLYCPTTVVTRGQMAAFLVRAFGL